MLRRYLYLGGEAAKLIVCLYVSLRASSCQDQVLINTVAALVFLCAPLSPPSCPLQQVLELCAGSPDCYISYDWNNRLKYAFIFHFFGLLWTNQFIVGLSSVVVAGAVANFYWSRGDTKRWVLSGLFISSEAAMQAVRMRSTGQICRGAQAE